jgi:hypothetical protein
MTTTTIKMTMMKVIDSIIAMILYGLTKTNDLRVRLSDEYVKSSECGGVTILVSYQ